MSQEPTDPQPFRAKEMETSAGSWARGTRFALATGLSSLHYTRNKIRRGKFNLRMWDAYCSICKASISSRLNKSV